MKPTNLQFMLNTIKKAKELMTKKRDVFEEMELAQYNKIVLDGLLDAERTRTSECIHEHNWRDDVTIEDAIDMNRKLDKYRNK